MICSSEIRDGSIFLVRVSLFLLFRKTILPVIKSKIVLITCGSDYNMPMGQRYAK